MLLAQVVVEPRGEGAAEQRVHHLVRGVGRIRPGRPDAAEPERRLRGVLLVDEPHRAARELPRRGQRLWRRDRGRRLPGPEGLLEQRQDGSGDVAHDDERRGTGLVARRVEAAQLRDREGRDLRRVARAGHPVTVARAEHRLGQRARGDGAGLVAGLQQVGEGLLAQALQLGLGEVRPQRDVRHQRERFVEADERHPQRHRRRVPGRAGPEGRTQEVDGVGERERVLAGSTFVEHVRGQRRKPLASGRIGGRTRAQHEDRLDDRDLVHAHQQHREAVREREPLGRGQLERAHRPGLRGAAAVGLGQERCRGQQPGRGEGEPAGDVPGAHRATSCTPSSFFPSGTTEIKTRPGPRKRAAAACTSFGASAR